jgi:Protein of unknown function (DUF1559)
MAFPPPRGFPMLTQRSRLRLILRLGLSLVMAWSMAGCGGASSAGATAAPISPEMRKKVDENLNGDDQRAAARAKAQRSTRSAPGRRWAPARSPLDNSTFIGAQSAHPGGINALFGDATVRFVKDSITRRVRRSLGTRSGDEIISADDY